MRTWQICARFLLLSLADHYAHLILNRPIGFAVISFLFGLHTLYCEVAVRVVLLPEIHELDEAAS